MPPELTIAIISAVLLLLGVSLWMKGDYLILHGKKANAVVTKNIEKSETYKGVTGTLYYPVVKFKLDNGEPFVHEFDFGINPPFEKGKNLKVIYDPNDLTNVKINSTFLLEMLPRLMVSIGLFGFVIGLLEYMEVVDWF